MRLWLHVEDGAPVARAVGDYVGSPMYEVLPEHGLAVFLAALLVPGWWLFKRVAERRGRSALVAGYRRLPMVRKFLFWLLAITGVVHVGLVLGHEPYFMSALWLIGGAAALWVAYRLARGRSWRRWAALTLTASILGYVISSISGEAPDQLGLATKLVELTALAIVLRPVSGTRLRSIGASTAVIGAAVATAVGAWAGALVSGDGGHHLGEVPPPGVLLPAGEDRTATAAEQEAADHLYAEVVAAIARYEDPQVAAAAGYDIRGMAGTDFHAANAEYQADGIVMDPQRPENLLYAVGPDGPVLLGVMFEMPDIGVAGPDVAGPLIVWHAHDHVCFSLTPPALAGLVSPFGSCPLGSIAVPVTGEMLHVWTLPGVPERYGDLEDEWLRAYLAGG